MTATGWIITAFILAIVATILLACLLDDLRAEREALTERDDREPRIRNGEFMFAGEQNEGDDE